MTAYNSHRTRTTKTTGQWHFHGLWYSCANSAVGQLSWTSICIRGSLLCSELQVLKPQLKERREGKARGGPWPLPSTDGQCSPWNGLMLGIDERCVFLRDAVKEETEKEGSNLITLSKASNTCLMFPHIWWDLHSLSLMQKLSWLVLTPESGILQCSVAGRLLQSDLSSS